MESPSPQPSKIPRIRLADYLNRVDDLYEYAKVRPGGIHAQAKTHEFKAMIDGYENAESKYVHHIYTVAQGVRLYTQAVLDRENMGLIGFLDSAKDAEFYETWIAHPDLQDKFIMNTTNENLAWDVHASFFEEMSRGKSGRSALDWLQFKSRFSKMSCETDKSLPLIDHITRNVRKRLRILEANPGNAA